METIEFFDFSLLWNIFSSLIFQILFFVTSVFYIYKKQSFDGYLMASGSFIHIFTNLFYSLGVPLLSRSSGMSMLHNSLVFTIVSIISFFASVLFIIGFIMLVFNYLSLQKMVIEKNT